MLDRVFWQPTSTHSFMWLSSMQTLQAHKEAGLQNQWTAHTGQCRCHFFSCPYLHATNATPVCPFMYLQECEIEKDETGWRMYGNRNWSKVEKRFWMYWVSFILLHLHEAWALALMQRASIHPVLLYACRYNWLKSACWQQEGKSEEGNLHLDGFCEKKKQTKKKSEICRTNKVDRNSLYSPCMTWLKNLCKLRQ